MKKINRIKIENTYLRKACHPALDAGSPAFGTVLFVFFLLISGLAVAQSPKRDVRATWLSTVWRLDWPTATVPAATGNNEAARETVRNAQKSGLLTILNKLQAANFNTVFFQVRGMSDAFYNSQYEPWSAYLSSIRGDDPGWDPLAYIIEEAHTRGIEVHAWLNPYRYSTSAESHGNLPNDYAALHPDWLLDYGSYTKILNPGMPEVRQRICDVVEDIITHYDVDGVIFDDYFYVEGISDALDNAQYQVYNPLGLSRADWRRDNVNRMVRDVQVRINSLKPYLTFGIGPAGVAASDASVAAKYGVDKSPVGSDWQYNGIYSDPLAWLSDGSIDYISPQLYWAIGSGTDYSKLSPWWAKIANRFGRHYYSSNTSSYSNATTELPAEVQVNRDADLNGTTGAVFFRTNNLTQTALNALKANSYQHPALRAAYGWKTAPTQTLVDNLALSGQNLTWNYTDNNVRYCIYALPNANRDDADAFTSSKYLQGIAYSKSYTLPAEVNASTHKIAVAVYDRYGNEFPSRVLGETATSLAAVQLTYPADNAENVVLPALFTWDSTNDADYHVWELSANVDFTQPIASRETTEAAFNSGLQANIKENTTYYWRVKSLKANALLAVSEVRSFNGAKFKLISPADAAVNVSMTPEFSWTNIGEGATYTLEISAKSDFSTMAYTTTVQTTTANVPDGVLSTATTYYARVKAVLGVIQAISERIYFVTEELPVPVPVLVSPIDGATIAGTEIEISWQVQNSKGFRAELSQNSTFPTRGTTLKSVEAFTYSAVYSDLDPGAYYLRVRAQNSEGLTEPSAFVTVYLTGSTAITGVDALGSCYSYYDAAGNCHIVINSAESSPASIAVYSITGVSLNKHTFGLNVGKNTLSLDMARYAKGFYLIKINTGSSEKTLKVRK
ncbi:MAG: family 10 glycosylhydrolase [Candidatus Symbiothrix sp.]|jgi:uncharacterized lipoprotein YddW (UPF0748 family)|nr:family 10 glycosylhydrolase [Candidatus Symbiothrix sp.]